MWWWSCVFPVNLPSVIPFDGDPGDETAIAKPESANRVLAVVANLRVLVTVWVGMRTDSAWDGVVFP